MEHISLVQRKIYRELLHDITGNGSEFQTSLKCNTGEHILIKDLIDYGWYYIAGEDDGQGNGQKAYRSGIGTIQNIENGIYNSAETWKIDGVDWLSEGMRVGDSVWLAFKNGGTDYSVIGVIQAINGDTFTIIHNIVTGGVQECINFKITNNTQLKDWEIYAEFQTLDNEDVVNLATSERNYTKIVELTNTLQNALYFGANKAGYSMRIKARIVQSGINNPVLGLPATVVRYEVQYDIEVPFWLENNGLDKIFKGNSTLRFNTRLDLKSNNKYGKFAVRTLEINEANTEIGYYYEDGLSGKKFIESANFRNDSVKYIDILNETTVKFRIETSILSTDNALNTGDKFSISLFAKNDSSDYQFNDLGVWQAFGHEYKFSVLNTVTVGTGLIKSISSGVGVANGKKHIEVFLTVDYNLYDYKERFIEGDEWRVVFNFKGINNEVNACFVDGVFIQNTDEEDLLITDSFKIHDQFSNLLTQNQNSLKTNIQDTIYIDYVFYTTNTFGWNLLNEIKSVNVRLIAYRLLNGEEKWFNLTNQNVNLGIVNRGDADQILLNNTYLSDYAVDKTNLDTIAINTVASGFGNTSYSLKCPLKITWQDWNEIEADPLFYNEDLDFNGFNQNAMTYFNKLGFTIHACVDVELYRGASGITTIYRQKSEPLQLIDKNDGYLIDPIEIKTYDLNNNDLNGNLLQGEPTRIEAKFAHDNLPNVATIFAYELVEQNGFALIENSTGGTLQGLWVTKPTIKSITATEVIVQAQINSDGNAYNISCKIQEAPADVNEYNFEYNEDYN